MSEWDRLSLDRSARLSRVAHLTRGKQVAHHQVRDLLHGVLECGDRVVCKGTIRRALQRSIYRVDDGASTVAESERRPIAID
jgi:hypothetical protein